MPIPPHEGSHDERERRQDEKCCDHYLEDGRTTRLLPAASRAAFVGFSWGAEVGCAFAARYPEQTIGLALIDGGYADYADRPGVDAGVGLEAHIATARKMASDESYPSWEAYFQAEREALRRWTPALAEAHRAMREEDGRVFPILSAEAFGAIRFGCCQQPTTATYPALRASRVPVLLVTPNEHPGREAVAREGIARLQAEVPRLGLRQLPGDVHDLVSHAADDVARILGEWLRDVPRDP